MPSFDLLIPFFIAASLLACTPGPGMLYTAVQTIGRGRNAGWCSALGLHLGSYVHVAAASFGLTLVLVAVPMFYAIIKLAGALYLLWLGYQFFVSTSIVPKPTKLVEGMPPLSAFKESLVVAVLNPKSALFFIAFLPQFTDPSASFPVWLQILILGTITNFVFSFVVLLCVLFASKVATLVMASQSATKWLRRIGGSILITLGLNLAFSKQ